MPASSPLSSRGLGRRILSPETGVQIPVAVWLWQADPVRDKAMNLVFGNVSGNRCQARRLVGSGCATRGDAVDVAAVLPPRYEFCCRCCRHLMEGHFSSPACQISVSPEPRLWGEKGRGGGPEVGFIAMGETSTSD